MFPASYGFRGVGLGFTITYPTMDIDDLTHNLSRVITGIVDAALSQDLADAANIFDTPIHNSQGEPTHHLKVLLAPITYPELDKDGGTRTASSFKVSVALVELNATDEPCPTSRAH